MHSIKPLKEENNGAQLHSSKYYMHSEVPPRGHWGRSASVPAVAAGPSPSWSKAAFPTHSPQTPVLLSREGASPVKKAAMTVAPETDCFFTR